MRSVKVTLRSQLKDSAPKEEVLHTFLCEAEAMVNSRPLTHVSIDADDEEALTPFHFLIGTSSIPGVATNGRPVLEEMDTRISTNADTSNQVSSGSRGGGGDARPPCRQKKKKKKKN